MFFVFSFLGMSSPPPFSPVLSRVYIFINLFCLDQLVNDVLGEEMEETYNEAATFWQGLKRELALAISEKQGFLNQVPSPPALARHTRMCVSVCVCVCLQACVLLLYVCAFVCVSSLVVAK